MGNSILFDGSCEQVNTFNIDFLIIQTYVFIKILRHLKLLQNKNGRIFFYLHQKWCLDVFFSATSFKKYTIFGAARKNFGPFSFVTALVFFVVIMNFFSIQVCLWHLAIFCQLQELADIDLATLLVLPAQRTLVLYFSFSNASTNG